MTLEEQLLYVETHFPDAWEYLHDTAGVPLPKFNDDDEVVSWGLATQDYDADKKEDKRA